MYMYMYICIVLHYVVLHYVTLHYVTLHYITLHYITLHYITSHYSTLYYITCSIHMWHMVVCYTELLDKAFHKHPRALADVPQLFLDATAVSPTNRIAPSDHSAVAQDGSKGTHGGLARFGSGRPV